MEQGQYLFANREIGSGGENVVENIRKARERGYPIPEDPNRAVSRTLEAHGLVRCASPIPEADKYISSRINSSHDGFPGFNYGTFVQNEDGKIAFAKLRYGPKNSEKIEIGGALMDVQVGGLHREAEVLKALSENGYQIPNVLGYKPATPEDRDPEPDKAETLEMLIIEAIPFVEGSTFPPERWTPELAKRAAMKMKSFDKPTAEISLFYKEERDLPLEILERRSRLSDEDRYVSSLKQVKASYAHLDTPIVVHGDTWLNNIIVKYDNSDVLFVDWELAGAGYKGQDAGRTLWGLTLDKDWNFGDVNNTARAFIDEWGRSEDDRRSLRFGVSFESLRWIADRQDKLQDQNLDPKVKQSIEAKIADVKAHTLKILDHIPKIQKDVDIHV